MMKQYELEKTDILIIGAGAAGARAAIACADKGIKAMLVTKGIFGKGGITPVGFEGFSGNFDQPGDSPELHLEELVKTGKFLCDQDVTEVMTNKALDEIRYLDQLGVRFSKENSKFQPNPTPGCKVPRMMKIWGGGHSLVKKLKKKVEEYSAYPPLIDVREDTIISRILVKNNQVYGAIGLDIRKGVIRVFNSKALILAAGGAGFIWPQSDCPPESIGDAYALAYNAGVKIVNMEQQLMYPSNVLFPESIKGLELPYEWCLNKENPKLGGWLVNGEGEVLYPLEETETIGTRDFMTHIITKEVKEGRGTPHGGIYLDVTGVSESRKALLVKMVYSYKRLLDYGIDIINQKVEILPGAHTTLGGAKIDPESRTNVNGLFACGEATGNVHGANRIAGHSYLDTMVFGAISGKFAAEFAKENDWNSVDEAQIEEECNNLYSYFGKKKDGIPAYNLKSNIVQLIGECMSPIRNKDGLKKGIKEIELMKTNDLARVDSPDIREYNNDWYEAIELRHMLDCAGMVTKCALLREESRGTHYREDFPDMDNENPVKHTVVQLRNGEMKLTTEAVNLSKFEPPKEKGPAF
jgi:fumarate reductase (CoM/CoB) subunit A